MQEEKIKRTQQPSQAADKPKSARIGIRWLRAAGIELLWGSGAWLLGQAQMLFGTHPLGLALLCGAPKHTASILAGLLITTLTNLRDPIVYICTYLAAALIRIFASMLLDSPDAKFELPESLRKKLHERSASEKAVESEESNGTFHVRREKHAAGDQNGRLAQLADLFSESVCLRMTTAAISSLIISLYYVISGGFLYYDLFGAIFSVVFVPVAVLLFSVSLESRVEIAWVKYAAQGALLFSFVFAAQTVTMPLSYNRLQR